MTGGRHERLGMGIGGVHPWKKMSGGGGRWILGFLWRGQKRRKKESWEEPWELKVGGEMLYFELHLEKERCEEGEEGEVGRSVVGEYKELLEGWGGGRVLLGFVHPFLQKSSLGWWVEHGGRGATTLLREFPVVGLATHTRRRGASPSLISRTDVRPSSSSSYPYSSSQVGRVGQLGTSAVDSYDLPMEL